MKIDESTRRSIIHDSLTLAHRHYLKLIVAAGSHPLNTPVMEDLIRLGLARREGNKVVPTADGRYTASLF